MRRNFTGLFENFGVDLVFSGHNHIYERSYPVKGHRGKSASFSESHLTDNGDGRTDGDDAYTVPAGGLDHGVIYTVAGSSSRASSRRLSNGPLGYPVHYLSMRELGSVALDFDGDTMNFTFVSPNPDAKDYFTIIRQNSDIGSPS